MLQTKSSIRKTIDSAALLDFQEVQTSNEHLEAFSGKVPPGCNVSYLPLVSDEYLSTDFSLDAPEPPKLGLNLSGAVPVGAEQYRCKRLGHVLRSSLLRNVSLFFHKHEIPHFLSYGTLLGAYRHGTISWWDDDTDMVIQEEDVDKILDANQLAKMYGFAFQMHQSQRPVNYKLATSYLYPQNREAGNLLFLRADTSLSPEVLTPEGCPRFDPMISKRGIYVELFIMSPVRFPFDTGLFTFGHDELYSYADIFPLKDCWLDEHRFPCPHRTRVVLTRMYKSLSLLHEFNASACELQLKEQGALTSSKWRSERLSNESFPDMPLLREGPSSSLVVFVPEAYKEELREARLAPRFLSTPAVIGRKWKARAGCDWTWVEEFGGFRKNWSNSLCMPALEEKPAAGWEFGKPL